ncbi:MAG: TetR/AcrR family transcriptional regulator [Alistipes sp.]|nr:TetR/AcrR family transcriptional regulator [Alistipes sp.]
MTQREQIVENAMRMFVSQGIKSVRMDDIAQELGISKRTLYEMFGDKEELLYLCLKRHMTLVNDCVAEKARTGGNMLESILIGFVEMTQYSETNSRITGNLRKFYPSVHDRLHRELGENGSRRFKNAIEECVNHGLIDGKANIDLAIKMLYYMAIGIVARKEVILPDGLSVRDAFLHVVMLFFRGISTPEGMRVIDDFAESGRFGLRIHDSDDNAEKVNE